MYKTERHKCFVCNRELDDSWVIWDKTNKEAKSKVIKQDNKVYHGKTILCKCGLAQEAEPMTEVSLNQFYRGLYRELYPVNSKSVEFHLNNMLNISFDIIKQFIKSVRVTILIVGAGTEDITIVKKYLPQSMVYTYDPSLPESDTNYNTLPKDANFDLVLCGNTLEHVYNPVQFLQDLRTVCKVKYIILTVPDLLTSMALVPKDVWFSNAHIYHFSLESLLKVVYKAGWGVVASTEYLEEIGSKLCLVLGELDQPVEMLSIYKAYEEEYLDLIKEQMTIMDRLFYLRHEFQFLHEKRRKQIQEEVNKLNSKNGVANNEC